MIIGRDILFKIIIDLRFSDNTISGNGGMYKVYTSPIRDISRIDFNMTSNWIKDKIVWND